MASSGRSYFYINRQSEWSCGACTLKNSSNSVFCAACGGSRSVNAVPDQDENRQARKDTNGNDRPSTYPPSIPPTRSTEVVGPRRALRPRVGSNSDGKLWSCDKCTLLNSPTALFCGACNSDKPKETVESVQSVPVKKKPPIDRRKSNDPRAPLKPGVKETIHEIATTCQAMGEEFVDDSFPPGPKALFINALQGNIRFGDIEFKVPDTWLRPRQIKCDGEGKGLNWAVMRDPVPSDICQGSLGDCWFIGSLAVLAERKDLLENIVQTKQINPFGVYVVRLNHYGRWKDVIVDDLFPCDRYGRLLYGRATRKQLWVPLIEKAMAKLSGSYEALIGGTTSESLTALTGFPCSMVVLNETPDDLDMMWAKLVSSSAAGFLMGAGTPSHNPIKIQECERMGLQSRHAYSILEVNYEWGPRLIKLRNPWGKGGWVGDWSVNSPTWTPAMKTAFRSEKWDRGEFWMGFEDFVSHFDVLYVCRIRQNWDYTSFHGIFVPYADEANHPCYSLELNKPTELDMTLYQCSWIRRIKNPNFSVPDIAIVLLKMTETFTSAKSWKLIKYTQRVKDRDVNLNLMLDPGKYAMVPVSFAHWTDKDSEETFPEFEIMIHSSRPIKCKRTTPPPNLLADVIINVGLDSCDRQAINGDKVFLLQHKSHQPFGRGSLFIVENNHSNRWVGVEIDLEGSFNIAGTRGTTTLDCVPPKTRQIVNLITSCNGKDAYRIASNIRTVGGTKNGGPPDLNRLGYPSGSDSQLHIPILTFRNAALHVPRPI